MSTVYTTKTQFSCFRFRLFCCLSFLCLSLPSSPFPFSFSSLRFLLFVSRFYLPCRLAATFWTTLLHFGESFSKTFCHRFQRVHCTSTPLATWTLLSKTSAPPQCIFTPSWWTLGPHRCNGLHGHARNKSRKMHAICFRVCQPPC